MATQSEQLSRKELERARKRRNEYHQAAALLDASACRAQEISSDLLQAVAHARRAGGGGLAHRVTDARRGAIMLVSVVEQLHVDAEQLRDRAL